MDLNRHFTIFFHGVNKNNFNLSSPYQPTYNSYLQFPFFVSKPNFFTLDQVTNRTTQITPNSNKSSSTAARTLSSSAPTTNHSQTDQTGLT